MRNRAKCLLCGDIIESIHRHDYVTCKCGEISIDGGSGNGYMRARANDWSFFMRIDDDGKEIIPQDIVSKEQAKKEMFESVNPLYKDDVCVYKLLDMIQSKHDIIKNLPSHAKLNGVNLSEIEELLNILVPLLTKMLKIDRQG